MTANSPPYALQAGSHSAQLFRQAISTLLAPTGGVVGSGDYAVTQNGTPNMSVNVAGGAPGSGGGIWVPGTTAVGVQGLYYGFNDATVNLSIAASNPTNPRIDTPIAQVQDAAYAGAVSSFSLAVVTGTPAASPVAPSLPASSFALANIAVAANATTVVNANITDRRSQAALGMRGSHSPLGQGGASIIATTETTSSTTYTTLTTPDRVSNVAMGASDLLLVDVNMTWQSSVVNSGAAALFIDGNQLAQVAGSSFPNNAGTQSSAGTDSYLTTAIAGLLGGSISGWVEPSTPWVATTNANGQSTNYPLIIRGVGAGVHTVEVRFKVTVGGTVTARNRKLRAWVEAF